MTVWKRVVGDTNDTVVATLNGVTDLSGISAIEAHVTWPPTGASTTLTAVVTSVVDRTVTVSLGSWITNAAAGVWDLEVQAIAAGAIRTWPSGVPDTIELRPQGDSFIGVPAPAGAAHYAPPPTGIAATDTADIVAFLAASSAGDWLVFPAGEYSINALISYPANRRYTGSGSMGTTRTVFKMAAAANLDAVWAADTWSSASATPTSAAPVVFEHICFDANSSNQTGGAGHGLVGMNYQSRIVDCKAANTRGDCFRWTSQTLAGNTITNSCNEVYFERNQALNAGGDLYRIHEGDATNRLTDGFMIGNIGNTGASRGIVVDKGAGWTVAFNHCYGVPFDNIKIGAAFNTKVTGNYCEGWGSSATPGTYHGINLSSAGLISAGATTVANNTVWANSVPVTGTTLRGIAVTAANSQSVRSTVTGNALVGRTHTTATSGMLVNCNDSGGTMIAAVSGNTSTGWDTNYQVGTVGAVFIAAGGNAGTTVVNETFSATPTINSAKAACNGCWRMILTANVTSSTITDGVDGQTVMVQMVQDAGGVRTLVWPSNVSGAPAITTGANAVTTVPLTYIASTDTWYAH